MKNLTSKGFILNCRFIASFGGFAVKYGKLEKKLICKSWPAAGKMSEKKGGDGKGMGERGLAADVLPSGSSNRGPVSVNSRGEREDESEYSSKPAVGGHSVPMLRVKGGSMRTTGAPPADLSAEEQVKVLKAEVMRLERLMGQDGRKGAGSRCPTLR